MLAKGGGGSGGLKTVTLTQAAYDALVENNTVDKDTFYMIVDEDGD